MRRDQMLEEHQLQLDMLKAKTGAISRRGRGGRYDEEDDGDEGRGGGRGMGGIEGVFQEYMEQKLLQMLQGEGQEKDGGMFSNLKPLLEMLGAMLAPVIMAQSQAGQAVQAGLQPGGARVIGAAPAPYPYQPGQPAEPIATSPDGYGAEPTPIHTMEEEDLTPLLFDVFEPSHIEQLLGHPDKERAGAAAWAAVQDAMQHMGELEKKKTDMTVRSMVKLPFGVVVVLLQGYKVYPDWQPIIAYIEHHQADFEAFQHAISEAVEGRGPRLTDDEDEDDDDGAQDPNNQTYREPFPEGAVL